MAPPVNPKPPLLDTEGNFDATVNLASLAQEDFFDGGNSSKSYHELRSLLQCNQIKGITECALELIEFIMLGKVEKGEVPTESC